MRQPAFHIEAPRLWIAFIGFNARQTALLEEWLNEINALFNPTAIHWRISKPQYADLILHALPHQNSRNTADSTGFEPLEHCFWPNEQEMHAESFGPSRQRFLSILSSLEGLLQFRAARFTLASLLVDRHEAKLPLKGVWHLIADGQLVAVVDFSHLLVALKPHTHYLQLDLCSWAQRPSKAIAPGSFMSYPIERLMWEYARRSERRLLPNRYFDHQISLRRIPKLPLSYLNEIELSVLTTLRQGPSTLALISKYLGLAMEQTAQLLGAMYFAGAITTRQLSFWSKLAMNMSISKENAFPASQTSLPWSAKPYSGPPALILGQTASLQRLSR